MPRPKKDPTKSSLTIAVAAHVLVFLIVFVWAAKTGKLDPVLRVFDIVPVKKPEPPKEKEKPKEEPPPQPTETAEAAPPDDAPPPTQRLTSSTPNPNAPAAANSSFFSATARTAEDIKNPPRIGPVSAGPATTKSGSGAPTIATPKKKLSAEPAKSSSNVKLLEIRQKAAAVTDSIGSEQISKTGSSDAAEVVAKVAGASVVDGKYVVVRGLSDRYTTTTLNGADVPTADPYRKSVQLDLFPAAMTDRIVVSKTFTPDQPGGFTGGAINIVTKSFPEKFIFSVSGGVSYNTQATGSKDFLTYKGGRSDWLGFDDGTRALPEILDDEDLTTPIPPTLAGRRETDEEAAERKAQADELVRLSRAFTSTEFSPSKTEAPMNRNFGFSMGDTILLFERPLGLFGALSYKRDFQVHTNSVVRRYTVEKALSEDYIDTKGVDEVAWGSAFNVAYQLHPDHEIAFNFLYNQSSEDVARRREGVDLKTGDADSISELNLLSFTERHLHAYQFKGKHEFPMLLDLKTDWLVSLANTTQDEPDLRFFNFFKGPDGSGGTAYTIGSAALKVPIFPTRYWRHLNEDNENFKLDNAIPFRLWDGEEGEFKLGIFQSISARDFDEDTYSFKGDHFFRTNGNPNLYLDPEFIRYDEDVNRRNQTNYLFFGPNKPSYHYISKDIGNGFYRGTNEIQAGYLMMDLPVTSRLRLVCGVRYETTDLTLESSDPNRDNPTGVTNSQIRAFDLLPAAGLIFQLRENVNLRLNYGETIARPTFREIAAYQAYDITEDLILEGNPTLKKTDIKNYDFRLEWFPRPGEVLSASGFYKELTNPIERYSITLDDGIIKYTNRENAVIYGVELEARKSLDFLDSLLDDFSLGINVALIKSEVELNSVELFNKRLVDPDVPEKRPLYDQSPYIINADFSYHNARIGTSASLIYSISGERIYFTKGIGDDVYERSAPILDFIFSQQIRGGWKLKFSAKNLLDPVFERTYGKNSRDFIFTRQTKGRTFGVSLAYDF